MALEFPVQTVLYIYKYIVNVMLLLDLLTFTFPVEHELQFTVRIFFYYLPSIFSINILVQQFNIHWSIHFVIGNFPLCPKPFI